MALRVAQLSIQLIEKLQPVMGRIRQRDKSLADQLTRAATSVCLNLSEAEHSDAENRRARFFSAAGSASETRMALRVAVAWHYVAKGEGEPAAACSTASSPPSGSSPTS